MARIVATGDVSARLDALQAEIAKTVFSDPGCVKSAVELLSGKRNVQTLSLVILELERNAFQGTRGALAEAFERRVASFGAAGVQSSDGDRVPLNPLGALAGAFAERGAEYQLGQVYEAFLRAQARCGPVGFAASLQSFKSVVDYALERGQLVLRSDKEGQLVAVWKH